MNKDDLLDLFRDFVKEHEEDFDSCILDDENDLDQFMDDVDSIIRPYVNIDEDE